VSKQQGVLRRLFDSNVSLMAAGYNKLIEETKMMKAN